MMICKQCRDEFLVWPYRHDERYARLSKDPNIRAQWSKGGDTNLTRRQTPSGLNMKEQPQQLQPLPEQPPSPSAPEPQQLQPLPEQPPSPSAPEPSSSVPNPPSQVDEAPSHAEGPPSPTPEPSFQSAAHSSPASSLSPQSTPSYSVGEGLEDDLEQSLADDENVPSDDDEPTVEEAETESIVVDMVDDSFIKGKVLLLPVMSGDCEVPQCCLCHQPTFDGEQLTNHLEFKLRLNAILSENQNTFGIVFDYSRGNAPYQMVCEDCLVSRSDSPDGQNVRDG